MPSAGGLERLVGDGSLIINDRSRGCASRGAELGIGIWRWRCFSVAALLFLYRLRDSIALRNLWGWLPLTPSERSRFGILSGSSFTLELWSSQKAKTMGVCGRRQGEKSAPVR